MPISTARKARRHGRGNMSRGVRDDVEEIDGLRDELAHLRLEVARLRQDLDIASKQSKG